MLDCDLKNGWAQFLDFIQNRCSSAEFENWLAPIQFVKGTTEELFLEVPNIFVQEYLLENYKEVLREFVPLHPSGEIAISFTITPPRKVERKAIISPATVTELTEDCFAYQLKLNPQYTFENFIEGPSNQFVKSAAVGIAVRPGKTYNPLFIHGGVGLGKTHLLHGIGHYIRGYQRKVKIQAITTEAFINDIVDALRTKSIDRMKRFYRSLDVLLVDDIQFLQNRLNFEEEFCNTFESLIHQNKQIVITSDKPPSQLKLSERMIARMEWGLVAHMGIPDLETRVAIIKHKAEYRGLSLDNHLAFYIAEHVYHNVRQLEGAINRLCAQTRFQASQLTLEAVDRLLSEILQISPQKKITVEAVLQSVATAFSVRVTDLKGESRAKEVALPRQIAMYLAKEMIDDSLMRIASSFGGKTHSTLLHAWKKIAEQVKNNDALKRQIQLVRRNIES